MGDPSLIVVPSARVFMLKCNTYLKRDPGDHLRPICPIDRDSGLFPGQLKPPTTFADDPEEVEMMNLYESR